MSRYRLKNIFLLPPVALSALVICLAGSQLQACAEEEQSGTFEQSSYDGSEFNAKDFRDNSFFKNDFRDVKSRAFSSTHKFETDISIVRRRKDTDINVDSGEATGEGGIGERKNFDYGVISELAGDWVPSKIDLAYNGGFTNYPGNGAPVPYDLNGHVDAQRGKP